MSKITPGYYKVSAILTAAQFDFPVKAAADYLDGQPDYRRVTVGGLPFGSLDEVVLIPYTASEVVIAVDGNPDTVLEVDNGAPPLQD